jgi:hypothetical protein
MGEEVREPKYIQQDLRRARESGGCPLINVSVDHELFSSSTICDVSYNR